MIFAVNARFARRAQVPPLSHYPPKQPETPIQRMNGLIKAGWPANSIAVVDNQVVMISHETDAMWPI